MRAIASDVGSLISPRFQLAEGQDASVAVEVEADFAPVPRPAVDGAQAQLPDVLVDAADQDSLGQDAVARLCEVDETLAIEAHVKRPF